MKKTKKLENPKFTNVKRINNMGVSSEDENIIRKFIIIIVIIVILVGLIYWVTELTHKKEETKDTVTTGEIDYTVVSIGTMFNRPEKEYYVLIYDLEDENSILYSAVINKYLNDTSKKEKLYYCDLGNTLNKKYYDVNNDGKSNTSAKNINELDLGKLTLIKIKNGEIIKYLEDFETIKSELN